MKVSVMSDTVLMQEIPALVQGDDLDLSLYFRHDDDTYFNLTGYDEVRFKARLTSENTTKIDKTAAISVGTSGIAVLSLLSSDLASSGVYLTEVSCSSSSEIRSVSVGRLYVQEEL